ncbi:hypothetical protein Tco_0900776 [Tanacetum coccineum]
MRELREDSFSGNKDEDAHNHIDRVLSIVGLFNIPGVSKDAVMLRVFPFILTGSAKRWVDRLAPGTINTWDLLKKAFIQRPRSGPHLDKDCPLNEEVKQVKEVRYGELGRTMPFNMNNGGGKILAETIKKYIKEASMRQVKQEEWLKTFFHNLEKSQNRHDEIIQRLESRVTTLAKEAVTKTDKNKDFKEIFTDDGAPLYTPFDYSLEEIEYFLANSGFSDNDEFKNVTSIPDNDLKQTSPKQTTTNYIEPYVPLIPFPRRLEQHTEEALIHKTMESLKKIKLNRPFLKEIRQSNEYPKFMMDLVANKPLTIGR